MKTSWVVGSLKDINVHAGSTGGFLRAASSIFTQKTKTTDYDRKIIVNLLALIVMDNAPYYLVLLEKQPDASWSKANIPDYVAKIALSMIFSKLFYKS